MGKKNSGTRLFSIRRLLISLLLGLLLPASYAFMLSMASDYMNKPAPRYMVYPFGWPRPLWIFLAGRQPLESDILFGIMFVALCNIALYGTLVYVALTSLNLIKYKPVNFGSPPAPHISSQV